MKEKAEEKEQDSRELKGKLEAVSLPVFVWFGSECLQLLHSFGAKPLRISM